VRSSGSDSNDGLSASNAKASVQSAIDEAPLANESDYLLVNLDESGLTLSESVEIKSHHPPIHMKGDTGSGQTTIDGGGPAALDAAGSDILLTDMELIGGTSYSARVSQSNVFAENTRVAAGSGASWALLIVAKSYYQDDTNSELDARGVAGAKCAEVNAAIYQQNGTLYPNDDHTLTILESGGVAFVDGDIIGQGNGTSPGCVVQKEASLKITANTVQDVTYVANARNGGMANLRTIGTQTNIGRLYQAGNDAFVYDQINGDDMSVSANPSTLPQPTDIGLGTHVGAFVHSDARAGNYLHYGHSRTAQDWIPWGALEFSDPAASDIGLRQRGFDTTNNRWLYKDASGTVHYWDADGTL
jgi:hypothetical protein